MSEHTGIKANCRCGKPVELGTDGQWRHIKMVFDCRCAEPAEPVIEVAPGEPEWEGPPERETQRERSEYAASQRYPQVPAVPAQPETWDALARQCILSAKQGGTIPDELYDRAMAAHKRETVPAVPAQEAPRCKREKGHIWNILGRCICCDAPEPQAGAQPEVTEPCEFHSENAWGVCRVCAQRKAGAQVPSQDEPNWDEYARNEATCQAVGEEMYKQGLRDLCEELRTKKAALEAHLKTITAYATEAAKTPITREDMHDPLKAQTFYDEAKGFERLVLSEIGGGK